MTQIDQKPLLRSKTFLGIAAIMLILSLLVILTVRTFIFQSIAHMESAVVEQNIERVQRALQLQIDKLDTVARDWAPWDDAHQFIQDHNQGFIDSNLGEITLVNLNVSLMAFLDLYGTLVYGELLTSDSASTIPLSDNIQHVLRNTDLQCGQDLQCSKKGILTTSAGPLAFALRPITNSTESLPPSGTLIVGRFLDENSFSDIRQLTNLDIAFARFDRPAPSDFEQVRDLLTHDATPVIEIRSAHLISGYVKFSDFYDQTALILRVDTPRDLARLGARNFYFFLAAFLIVTGVTSVLIGFLVLRDLNKRQHNAMAIQQLNRELEARVADRTQKLAQANTSLQEEIRDRQQTETALRQSEEMYRNILDNIQEGYFELNLAGDLTFFNQALEGITGYSRQELTGLNNRAYTTPETSRNMYRVFNQLYRTGQPVQIMNHEVIRKDGEKRILELSANRVTDIAGVPVGFRGLARDVTERIVAENERLKLEMQLQTAQKMEAIATLAGGIAHNFNNLMMGMQGMASLAMMELTAEHPAYKRLESIGDMVESGAKLTRDLLGFARGGQSSVQSADLNQLIDKSLSLFERTCMDVQIIRNFSADLPAVEVDRGQIEQVLLNLFVNAWHAMLENDSSVRLLTVSTAGPGDTDAASILNASPGRQYVSFSVTDTGCGMDPETQARIFDPFFTTKSQDMRGTGLGLASVFGIVKGHSGHIEVNSNPGEGTTFTIFLPVSETAPLAETVLPRRTLVRGQGHILLVDDEDIVREVNQQILEAMGYTVMVADSGRQAVEIYRQHHDLIQAVILDMIMPDMNGRDTFGALKRIQPDVRVILASGYSRDEQVGRILAEGCKAFIQKPFRIEELSEILNEVLEHREPDEQLDAGAASV